MVRRRQCAARRRPAAAPAAGAALAAAATLLTVAATTAGFATPAASTTPAGGASRAWLRGGLRVAPIVARGAGERAAYIALVDVDVTPGKEEDFLAASMENARSSANEDDNQRFDVLQSQDELNRFALVEIYANAQGPVDHKGTSHYSVWRDAVADTMASPRKASQWDAVFPRDASSFRPDVVILEREEPVFFDIAHVFVDVKPGSEDAFIEATLRNAKESIKEDGNLRFDVLRSVEDPTKFLLVEVYRSPEAATVHKRTDHYARWRDTVAGMMATPRTAKKYLNHFPNLPAGWKVDEGVQ